MIIVPEHEIKLWCECCDGKGICENSSENSCVGCDGNGYIQKKVSDFLEFSNDNRDNVATLYSEKDNIRG